MDGADEGTIFFLGVPPVTTEADYLDELRRRYGDDAEAIAAVYPASNFRTPQDTAPSPTRCKATGPVSRTTATPTDAAVRWPRYDDAVDARLNFADEVTVASGFRRTECETWWRIYDRAFE